MINEDRLRAHVFALEDIKSYLVRDCPKYDCLDRAVENIETLIVKMKKDIPGYGLGTTSIKTVGETGI